MRFVLRCSWVVGCAAVTSMPALAQPSGTAPEHSKQAGEAPGIEEPWAQESASASQPEGSVTVTLGPGAESCPDTSALEDRIRVLLEQDVGVRAAVGVDVTFSVSEAGFRSDIEVSGARRGRRAIEAPGEDCVGVAEATAVVVALLLNPSQDSADLAMLESAEPPQADAVQESPVAEPPAAEPAVPDTPVVVAPKDAGIEPADSALQEPLRGGGWLYAGAGMTSGLLRGVAGHVAGGFELGLGAHRLGVGGFVTNEQVTNAFPGEVSLRVVGGEAGGWLRLIGDGRPVALSAGLGFIMAGVRGQATGYMEQVPAQWRRWYAFSGGMSLLGKISQNWAWETRAVLAVPITREAYFVRNVGDIYRTQGTTAFLNLSARTKVF